MTKPNVTITYGHGFLTDCNSYYDGTGGTADSGDTTHTVDSERTETIDYWNGTFIKYTSGPNIGLERKITDFVATTDTITHDAFPNPVAVGHTYIISSWGETEDGNVGTLSVDHDDWFHLYVTSSGSNKVYYVSYPNENGATNLTLSSTVYTKIFYRYVTGSATNIKAKILLVFSTWDYGLTEAQNLAATPPNGQIVLAETGTGDHWITGSTTITSGKTIDHIRLYANQDTGNVWYDFALICKGVFTFPNTERGLHFIPPERDAIIGIPCRDTDIIQHLGTESAQVTCSCNLDVGKLDTTASAVTTSDWMRPQGQQDKTGGDVVNGQVFLEIWHNRSTEPFQWLDTGKFQFKAALGKPEFIEMPDIHSLELLFREYSRSSKSNESYIERFGLNL